MYFFQTGTGPPDMLCVCVCVYIYIYICSAGSCPEGSVCFRLCPFLSSKLYLLPLSPASFPLFPSHERENQRAKGDVSKNWVDRPGRPFLVHGCTSCRLRRRKRQVCREPMHGFLRRRVAGQAQRVFPSSNAQLPKRAKKAAATRRRCEGGQDGFTWQIERLTDGTVAT